MTHPARPADETFQRVLPSTFENLERMVEETEAFLQRHGEDEDMVYRVTLLTSEAVTNAMEHGNKYDPQKTVTLNVVLGPEQIELIVEDEGEGFDPSSATNPLTPDHLMDDRGRGLFFMKQMADEVHPEKGGRRLRLVFVRTE